MQRPTRGLAATLVWIGFSLASPPAHADAAATVERLETLLEQTRQPEVRETLPVELIQELTAWQSVPLFTVLDERETTDPEHYTMTHPLFALRWSDGKLLVIDAGIALAEAGSFGAPTEWLGAEPIQCNAKAWQPLLAEGRRIEAVVFSHLHIDHTTGVRELCADSQVPVRLSPEQETSDERFEVQGRAALEADEGRCIRHEPWSVDDPKASVQALTDFPGAYRIAVPGHTPGSQIVVGFVATPDGGVRGHAIVGDVVNHRIGFERDVDKPWWYRWFVVREVAEQQSENRALLRALEKAGFEILVEHHLPGAEIGLESTPCP